MTEGIDVSNGALPAGPVCRLKACKAVVQLPGNGMALADDRKGWKPDTDTLRLNRRDVRGVIVLKRDKRLLAALILFGIALVAGLIQALIIRHYITAAVMGGEYWDHFVGIFGGKSPARGPKTLCFDYCAPDLPFIAGWIAVSTFLAGAFLVILAWWKPKS